MHLKYVGIATICNESNVPKLTSKNTGGSSEPRATLR